MTVMKPLLKWVGGKTQILEDVLNLFPPSMDNYHEPFVGGGSVLLGVLSRVKAGSLHLYGAVHAADANPNLIAFYRNVQGRVEELIVELRRLVDEFATCKSPGVVNRTATTAEEAHSSPESYYFWTRARFNGLVGADRETPAASAAFLFLNKTCFRGLYREGPRGFNVPFGNYKKPAILDEAHLRQVSALIQGVEFRVADFKDSLAVVKDGDFVYLDPPYAPETETSFVSYTADGFGGERHLALFEHCRSLPCQWLMSNADVKAVREAFSGYDMKPIVCRRAINSKKPDATTTEVLIRPLPLG
jgi:DNA adenine methylase